MKELNVASEINEMDENSKNEFMRTYIEAEDIVT
jgi:hypothetical protein